MKESIIKADIILKEKFNGLQWYLISTPKGSYRYVLCSEVEVI